MRFQSNINNSYVESLEVDITDALRVAIDSVNGDKTMDMIMADVVRFCIKNKFGTNHNICYLLYSHSISRPPKT